MFNHRDELGEYLNELGLLGTGVEIGSANGQFSARILSQWKGERLWLIDPWVKQDLNVYREVTNSITDFDAWHEQCEQLAKRDKRISLCRRLSMEAMRLFGDESLDLVYIDGNHSFEAVTADLDAWWSKVKPGGILGGHDFLTKMDDGWHCEVDRAVKEWATKQGLEYWVTPCTSWWIRKLERIQEREASKKDWEQLSRG